MNQRVKRVVLSALTTVVAAASLTLATTTQASAINQVSCGDEFLQVYIHPTNGSTQHLCYANAGTVGFGSGWWITRISTGNNRVQWQGDGRWQPDTPINKWTVFTWPNQSGGVNLTGIRIL
ncbi:beta/gamma crystallin domain-containing protein [Streptomyces sp. NPDC006700]|uniref:beta/gamma crystallin domain-containing protein n=1 Tax=Streptomyces sp. NPDC006700 TaxID=3154479 RepID=UPI0033C4947C